MNAIVIGCFVTVVGMGTEDYLVMDIDEIGNVTLSTGDVVSVWLCERVG